MANPAAETSQEPLTGRISIMALVITILCASLIYALVAFDTAHELRTRNALEQNSNAAQISARLLDEQWQDLLLATHELTEHGTVESDLLLHNRAGLTAELKYAVDLVPALMLAAVYDTNGERVACYPESPVASQHAADSAWFKGVTAQRSLYQSGAIRIRLPQQPLTELITIASPMGIRKRPSGYMMALYRVGDVDRWLQNLGLQGSDLYIVNSKGQVVDASVGADRTIQFTSYSAFRLAMNHSSGSRVSRSFYANEDADVGYAYAIRPGWAVIVARPVSLAMAPTQSVVGRLSLLGILVLALLLMGATLILRLYRTQHRMSLALSRQNAQLREADRVKSDFLANVSHDLRTPLASMQISISSLLEPELHWEPDEVKETLRVANESLDQISGRVTNLLEMARLEANIWPTNKQVCDLTDIVGAALERMKALISDRALRLNFPERPLLLECDPNQIETVIVNLLENANKYSAPGTSIGLTGTSMDGDENLCLSVVDNGPGIVVEDIERIFEKFYRSKRNAYVGGTGLGLAISSAIVEAHGGSIGAVNVVEGQAIVGARFWFTLPGLAGDSEETDEQH